MSQCFRGLSRLTASVIALSCAMVANAQAPAAGQGSAPASAAASADRASNGLGDIVVTARRRSESLQSVPVAITALSNKALEQRTITSVDQLRTAAPAVNISAQDRGEATFYIRGQGPGVVGGGQRNFTSVATYFAEVPTPIAGSGQLYDLANVQVLKGPQGTLFGRNTTGGAVLFEPNRPTFDLEGYVKGSFGNYRYGELEAVLNIPVIPDVLAIRIAGDEARRRGFTKSVLTGQHLDSRNNDSYRVSVLFKPTDSIDSVTIIDSNYRDNSGSGLSLRQAYAAAQISSLTLAPGFSLPILAGTPANSFIGCLSFALPGCPAPLPDGSPDAAAVIGAAIANGGFGLTGRTPQEFAAAQAAQAALGPRKVLEPFRLYRRIRDFGVTNKTTWTISDAITLKNIFSYRKERTGETGNISGPLAFLFSNYDFTNSTPRRSPEPPYIRGFEQYTEEFQIQGKMPSIGLNYVVGFYHEQAKPGFRQSYRSVSFGDITNTVQNYKDKSDAVFAHAELNILSGLQLSGGLRHTWDKRVASSSTFADDGTCKQAGGCPLSTGKLKFRALTGDVTLQYKLTPRALVYAAYRHGYKSGGGNLPPPTADTRLFKPEYLDEIELGLKADWDIGVPLRTNLSLFRDKYKDIQISLPIFANGTTLSAVQNAASAINKGVEFEGSVVPLRNFTLSGFVSYLDAQCQVNAGQACRKNRQIAFQPRWKWGVSGNYRLPLEDADVSLFAAYSFTGKVNTSDPDAKALGFSDTYPSYGVLDARIEWRDAIKPGIDLALFGNNLTNKTYIVGGFPLLSSLGVETVLYGDPRTFGGSIKVRFGGAD